MSEFKFSLGREAQDTITGLVGIITARVEYLFGCNTYEITPRSLEGGKKQETEWLDEGRIIITGEGVKAQVKSTFRHELGLKAEDKITGVRGILVGRIEHLYNCNSYGIAPRKKGGGKKLATEWFDEGRIEIKGNGIKAEEVQTVRPGGETSQHPREQLGPHRG